MKLIFDIVNTRLKWGIWDGLEFIDTSVLRVVDVTQDSLSQFFGGFIEKEREFGVNVQEEQAEKIESVWVSNVGSDQVLHQLSDWFGVNAGLSLNTITVTQHCGGIENRYKKLDSLGVDRWMAAVGSRKLLAEGDVIIVDAGTAVTVDWLSSEGRFEGGVILPGFNLMYDALLNKTESVKEIYSEKDFPNEEQIIGRLTNECVNYGVSFGLIGGIEKIVMQMQKKINRPAKIVLTGGSARLIHAACSFDSLERPNLVLLGAAVASEQV